ncbi:hypothetical protein SASPL_115974 [Salvia splendens]|uniref:LITAF domain-containing protein n=1 Tax=Salvia splendens TaxID=180675 RepID=A0A8X9A242_SALSN|nr:hypothetical protein SASPL_115974 [Salvia splendens]
MEKAAKSEEPAIGIPYNYQPPLPQRFYVENPHQAGAIPPNAVVGDPKGIPLQQTIYRDTPAPFNCPYCGGSGVTTVNMIALISRVYGLGWNLLIRFTLVVARNRWIDLNSQLNMNILRVSFGSPHGLDAAMNEHGLSKPSLAAVVGCMMPFMLGVCFLCPSMDCLWHKYHYCPSCNEKVADFEKSDICAVMDPPHYIQGSFALPA